MTNIQHRAFGGFGCASPSSVFRDSGRPCRPSTSISSSKMLHPPSPAPRQGGTSVRSLERYCRTARARLALHPFGFFCFKTVHFLPRFFFWPRKVLTRCFQRGLPVPWGFFRKNCIESSDFRRILSGERKGANQLPMNRSSHQQREKFPWSRPYTFSFMWRKRSRQGL